jgi:GNAT superfamily N-acetyltransferase
VTSTGTTATRRLEIGPFSDSDVADAAQLLAARHRHQRLVEPGLPASFEDPTVARGEIERLVGVAGASGSVARSGGRMAGFLLGTPRAERWGPNMWVEGPGHAVTEAETVRDLYGFAAAGWVADGRTAHYAIVPATDPALVDAWFRVGFGQQHVHAIREVPPSSDRREPPPTVRIRRAARGDIPVLARLELVLPEHQVASPVFSLVQPPPYEETLRELKADFDDPAYTLFVAENDGRVIGSAVGCSIERSSENHGIIRPDSAGFLGFAAVLPEARGLGAGRALGEAVLAWAGDAGYERVVTDWRETNLLSSRTWPRLGFRPTFRRLHRAIA